MFINHVKVDAKSRGIKFQLCKVSSRNLSYDIVPIDDAVLYTEKSVKRVGLTLIVLTTIKFLKSLTRGNSK